jgi:hypothetical protein
MLAAAAVAALLAAATAEGRQERDAQIRPSVGIGQIRLGMTLAQVRRILGPPQILNRRVKVGFGREHREYVWNWFEWTVAFRGTQGRFRVVRVVTSLRRHRYRGIGVGARIRTVVRVFPRARCRVFYPGGQHVIITTAGGRELRFVTHLGPSPHGEPVYVSEVIVQNALGPHGYALRSRGALPPFSVVVNPSLPCSPDWQRR